MEDVPGDRTRDDETSTSSYRDEERSDDQKMSLKAGRREEEGEPERERRGKEKVELTREPLGLHADLSHPMLGFEPF